MSAQINYINSIANSAVESTIGTGLFPSVMIAQAILESGYGQSVLSKEHNNHFGIKASTGWKGDVVNMNTREVFSGKNVTVNAGFRKYDTIKQGFKDRNDFLIKNPRYAKAGVFTAKTPQEQAQALQSAGYATDPNYAQLLTSLIARFGLTKYDKKKESLFS